MAKLVSVTERAAKTGGEISRREVNLVSWAAYVFAEKGDPTLIAPLVALGGLREEAVRPLIGAYADA